MTFISIIIKSALDLRQSIRSEGKYLISKKLTFYYGHFPSHPTTTQPYLWHLLCAGDIEQFTLIDVLMNLKLLHCSNHVRTLRQSQLCTEPGPEFLQPMGPISKVRPKSVETRASARNHANKSNMGRKSINGHLKEFNKSASWTNSLIYSKCLSAQLIFYQVFILFFQLKVDATWRCLQRVHIAYVIFTQLKWRCSWKFHITS